MHMFGLHFIYGAVPLDGCKFKVDQKQRGRNIVETACIAKTELRVWHPLFRLVEEKTIWK